MDYNFITLYSACTYLSIIIHRINSADFSWFSLTAISSPGKLQGLSSPDGYFFYLVYTCIKTRQLVPIRSCGHNISYFLPASPIHIIKHDKILHTWVEIRKLLFSQCSHSNHNYSDSYAHDQIFFLTMDEIYLMCKFMLNVRYNGWLLERMAVNKITLAQLSYHTHGTYLSRD